jgi:cytoskeletal protein CcmA (bactofilin family)
MTMFTRNDKTPEAAPRTTAPVTPEKSETQVTPVTPEPRRAVAQALPAESGPQSVSFISRAVKITGQLESSENIQVEGEVEGDIRGQTVKLGSASKIKGTVYGEEVELSGTVEGKIEAKRVVLTSTARMTGDVIHEDIAIQSGAYIDGHCRPTYGKTDAKKVSPPAKVEAVKAAGE